MARNHDTVQLQGVEGEFTILQLPAEKSYYLLLDIAAIVAPSAVGALKDSPGFDFGKLDLGTIGEALAGIFRKANRDEVKRITGDLFSSIEWSDGKSKLLLSQKGALDTVFSGNPLGILLLQKEALRVNYAGFFKGLAEAVREAVATAKTKALTFAASATSGGPSGDSSPSE